MTGRLFRLAVAKIPICLFACWLLAALPANVRETGAAEGPVISDIEISIPGDFSESALLERLARDLVRLKKGDLFSPSALEDSIRALRLSRRFSHVHVDSQEEGDCLALVFRLEPAPLVRDIRMKGIYPFFERDIRTVMTLSPGDMVTPQDLEEQRRLVENFFRREGFIHPRALFETAGDPREGFLSIALTVNRGPYYRLGSFTVRGASHYSESHLRNISAVHRKNMLPGVAGRFVEQRLEADIKNMLHRFREAGFADCSIEKELSRDSGRGVVDITLTVEEGPRYRVSFRGNEAFSDNQLEDELLFQTLGNRNNAALHRSSRAVVQRYRMAGYSEMKLDVEDETGAIEGMTVRTIQFRVTEGPCHRIGSFAVEGVTAFPERTVQSWLNLGPGKPFVSEQIDQAVLTIESALRSVGFLDANAEADVSWNDAEGQRIADITITVAEGVRTMISAVRFNGFESLTESEARGVAEINTGDPLMLQALERDRRALVAAVSERGRPHADVEERLVFSDDKSTVEIEFQADEGPPVIVDNVYLRGNFRTKDRILLRRMKLGPGEPFSATRFLESERNLRNLDILESARIRAPGLAEQAQEVTLLVDVAERKPYFVEAGFGYESERGAYADVKAGDRNLFGTNRSGWIGSALSETGYRSEIAASDPHFLGYSLSATLGLYQERVEQFNQTFGTDTYGASLKLARKLAPGLGIGLGLRFEQKKLFQREGLIPPGSEELYLARSILVAGPSLTYDTRDFFVRPRSGVFSVFSVDISKGIRNSFDDFLQYDLDVRYFYTPLARLTFALAGRGAVLQTYGPSGTIPEDQLLFLGGTTNVRGFKENTLRRDAAGAPLGGRLALSGSLEARIDLGKNWELATFFDTGSVSRTFDNAGSSGFRSSAGGGLRYITPVGPLGILYGAKLDRREGESSGRWHFSIGYTF